MSAAGQSDAALRASYAGLLEAASFDSQAASFLTNARELMSQARLRATAGSPEALASLQQLIARATLDARWRPDLAYFAGRIGRGSPSIADIDRAFGSLLEAIKTNKPNRASRRTWQDQVDTAQGDYEHPVTGRGTDPQDRAFETMLDELTSDWPPDARALVWRYRRIIDFMVPEGPGQSREMHRLLSHLLHGLGPTVTQSQNKALRRRVRERALAHLFAVAGNDLRVQNAILRDMLDAQPNSSAKGELFQWYVETRLGLDATEVSTKRESFHSRAKQGVGRNLKGLEPGRGTLLLPKGEADGTVKVKQNFAGQGGPPKGNYLLENKAGEGAFKADQADNYADLSDAKGKIVDQEGVSHDGVIYIFDSATSVPTDLVATLKAAKAKSSGNANFYVGFFEDGKIRWQPI